MKSPEIRIPADWESHGCCWMAWAVHREWDSAAARKIKRDLSNVIQTIVQYEPVRVLARGGLDYREARREFAGCSNVTVIEAPVDDFWMRDIMPTFALRDEDGSQGVVAIDWNFSGWGNTRERPSRPGDRLAENAAAIFGVPRMKASFVAEGGALVTDGQGMLITTRSCLLNPNRNPVRRRTDLQRVIETEMERFGIRKVIWLEGDLCEPITSGHADGYVLCAPDHVVLVEAIDDEQPFWRKHDIALLEKESNADGHELKVARIKAPRRRGRNADPEGFAACYVNAYVANGAVIGACFGDDERDEAARRALAKAFPGRETVMLRVDAIASGGGGVRCVTQGMPAIEK